MNPCFQVGGPDGGWLEFGAPDTELAAWRPADVRPALQAAEAALSRGFAVTAALAYEAAPAFDPAFVTRPPDGRLPLAWFGLHRDWRHAEHPPAAGGAARLGRLQTSETRAEHGRKLAIIKAAIAAGATYQVNHTLRLTAPFHGDPRGLFTRLAASQPGAYGVYLELGPIAIVSASPELFFALDGARLTLRPMKGTRPRGRWPAEDEALAAELAASIKDRAENLMILDMVRNDAGRVARIGSVSVRDAFRLERWPTVWQMTSTVHAETAAPLSAILVALFPCASITGAPKIQTMRLIAELESTPRGLYTGALGFALPERRAQFNVAIRTAVIDREAGSLSYGVGGGIVWDSQPKEEWAEALIKARALRRRPRVFDLLETLAWFPERGYWLLDRHLNRLSRSALYFGRPFDEVAVGEVLGAAATWDEAQRVRLLLDAEGRATVESAPLPPPPERPWRVAPAAARVDPRDPLLYHKTTLRTRYDRARRARPDVDDVLLVNRRGEVTESAVANVVFLRDGRLCTPPLACGLLPGVYRELLLERGWVREAVLHAEDLPLVEDLWLVNSVRGWIRAELRRG